MQEAIFKGKFYNPTKGYLNFNKVIEEIFSFMKEDPEKEYEIVVGCDSSSGEDPYFPVAIVILRKKAGGRFFLKKIKYHKKKFYNLHQRILEEVYLSCQLALALKGRIETQIQNESPGLNFEFKYIHADVGENGVTKDMIKEVIGLIRGNGFEAKIKPEAFAASVVADRFS